MIFMGCNLLEGIWSVGAASRTGQEPDALHLFNEPRFEDVMERTEYKGDGGIPGIVVGDQIAEHLLYYESAD